MFSRFQTIISLKFMFAFKLIRKPSDPAHVRCNLLCDHDCDCIRTRRELLSFLSFVFSPFFQPVFQVLSRTLYIIHVYVNIYSFGSTIYELLCCCQGKNFGRNLVGSWRPKRNLITFLNLNMYYFNERKIIFSLFHIIKITVMNTNWKKLQE